MEQDRPSQGDNIPISDDVLSALGIDRAAVQQEEQRRLAAKEQAIARTKQAGASLLNAFNQGTRQMEDIYIGDELRVHLSQTISRPSEALNALRGLLDLPLEELLRNVSRNGGGVIEADDVKPRLRAVLEGFGMAALEHHHLDIGLDAINAGTKGGILQNEGALSFLKRTYGDKPQAMVNVAERIEAIRNPKPPAGPATPAPPRPAGPMT